MSLLLVAATRPVAPSHLAVVQQEARAWVEANKSALPTTYDAVSQQPYEYRKAIWHTLTLPQMEALWRKQLDAFVLPTEQLTDAQRAVRAGLSKPLTDQQRAFIRVALDSLHQMFSDALPDEQRTELANRMCAYKKAIFDAELGAEVFARLGAPDSSYIQLSKPAPKPASVIPANVLAAVRRLAEKVMLAPKPLMNDCACNQGSNCECSGGACTQVQGDCNAISSNGCGCFWLFVCNGCCNGTCL
jgi:hypothetical protein